MTLTLLAVLTLLMAPQTVRLYVTCSIVCGFGLIGYQLFQTGPASGTQPTAGLPWKRLLATLLVLGVLVATFLARPPLPPHGLAQIALTFSGLSLRLFGDGYIFIPMIQDIVVTQYNWLTVQQFLDSIAFSQVTPGPILVIATFIAQNLVTEHSGPLMGVLGVLVGTRRFLPRQPSS